MNWVGELEAVAFDIDGTIYPNYTMYRASLPIVLANLRLFRAFGRARRMVRIDPPAKDLRLETARITASLLGADSTAVATRIDEVIYRRWEQVLRRVPLFPGVPETLRVLRERGYRIGALSDFPVVTKLELFGIDDLWDCVLCSEETGFLKPHRAPFLRLAECLQTETNRILYVGNSYRYDVLGARAVGMRTVHLARRPEPDSTADITISRWDELARILRAVAHEIDD